MRFHHLLAPPLSNEIPTTAPRALESVRMIEAQHLAVGLALRSFPPPALGLRLASIIAIEKSTETILADNFSISFKERLTENVNYRIKNINSVKSTSIT